MGLVRPSKGLITPLCGLIKPLRALKGSSRALKCFPRPCKAFEGLIRPVHSCGPCGNFLILSAVKTRRLTAISIGSDGYLSSGCCRPRYQEKQFLLWSLCPHGLRHIRPEHLLTCFGYKALRSPIMPLMGLVRPSKGLIRTLCGLKRLSRALKGSSKPCTPPSQVVDQGGPPADQLPALIYFWGELLSGRFTFGSESPIP